MRYTHNINSDTYIHTINIIYSRITLINTMSNLTYTRDTIIHTMSNLTYIRDTIIHTMSILTYIILERQLFTPCQF